MDSYEKELTVSISSQQQASRPRIEALEKSLEGYRELVENLEADLTSALGQGLSCVFNAYHRKGKGWLLVLIFFFSKIFRRSRGFIRKASPVVG